MKRLVTIWKVRRLLAECKRKRLAYDAALNRLEAALEPHRVGPRLPSHQG